jgi:hypothetical protein
MVYIDGVKFIEDYSGNEVISVLRWTETFNVQGSSFATKREMIQYVKDHPYGVKTKYRRYGSWHDGEYVRVVDNAYLRTDANNTKADNLGELDEF